MNSTIEEEKRHWMDDPKIAHLMKIDPVFFANIYETCEVKAIEGSIFNDDTIFLFKNDYYALKKCVENKKEKGHLELRIDLSQYKEKWFSPVLDTIKKVNSDTGIVLHID